VGVRVRGPISQTIVEIEIGIGIGIEEIEDIRGSGSIPDPFATLPPQHRNNTVAHPGFSCPNPIPRTFDTETDSAPEPASPLAFGDDLGEDKSCHRGHREHRGASSFPSESKAAEVGAFSSMAKERISL
jgi:hypothetical protein